MNRGGPSRSDAESCRRRFGGPAVAFGLACGLLACVGRWSPPAPTGRHRVEAVEAAGKRIGEEACYACHDSFSGHFVAGAGHSDCESCHGPAERHAFTARAVDIRYPGNRDCAECHRIGSKTLLGWSTSEHARSGILCSDCHDTHGRTLHRLREPAGARVAALRHAGATTRLCAGCHAEISAQFDLPSHHPIAEGMIGCTDCHAAHENRRHTLGAATQACLGCHQEVGGPFVYEHAPVSEDCGHCHAPHGASADSLLEASEPAACISCHSLPIAGAAHQPYAYTTRCTDCHNAVHGSYTDPHLRR